MTTELRLIADVFDRARVRRIRTIGEFAEQELRIPSGPHEGLRFRLDRHPVARMLFSELDSGRWQRAFITGPNQDGKTLMAFVIVIMYLLFERCERVVMAAPTAAIIEDKWQGELLPMIRPTRFVSLLPSRGGGANGGTPEAIRFGNGAILRNMTAGGDDQSRANFTARNVVTTETEGFDAVGSSSREGSKFDQLEKRNRAYGASALTVAECTVSHEQGRTWSEYMAGSRSRIVIPCRHCGEYVSPGREHLFGWQDAANEIEAGDLARLHCPSCGVAWSNDERLQSNQAGVVLHGEQTIDNNGVVTGAMPATRTLGFRWTCVNAAIDPDRMRLVAVREWKAKRAEDEDRAERDLCQIEWVIPAKQGAEDVSGLDSGRIMAKTRAGLGRGVVPNDTRALTLGTDVGKYLIHWVCVAWRADGSPHVVDYDVVEAPSNELVEARAIPIALSALRDRVERGWMRQDGTLMRPTIRLVDAGYLQDVVLDWSRIAGNPWFGSKGFGVGQQRSEGRKRESGSKVISDPEDVDHYALIRLPNGDEYVEVNSDYWKTWLHRRVTTPIDEPGGLTLFEGGEHLKFSKHLTAEREVVDYVEGVGMVRRWEIRNRNNHYGDALVYACVAGHAAGVRLATSMPGTPLPAVMVVEPPAVSGRTPGGWMRSHEGRY